ncbi:MAG: CRISPR-associated helicase Cas3' [Leptospiraceae bacterium]|nr:CRISPR-associated helicase Cas3' [Leptospiraceae bacterium]
MNSSYCYFWGKATDQGWHPLVYHMLDVAAVGVTYLRLNQNVKRFFLDKTNLAEGVFTDLFGFLLTLHDLGKFAPEFQLKNPLAIKAIGIDYGDVPMMAHHTITGMKIWNEIIKPRYSTSKLTTSKFRRSEETAIEILYWFASSAGHHGKPVELEPETTTTIGEAIPESVKGAILLFIEQLESIFPKAAQVLNDKQMLQGLKKNIRPLSYWLSGITILADWLASSKDFYPMTVDYTEGKNFTVISLNDYYSESLSKAAQTLPKTGLLPIKTQKSIRFTDLFPELIEINSQPTPLQKKAERIDIANGAKLFILEDITGAGKTEAAWILAGRIMSSGDADGIFMGLPTMATSNGMYPRISAVYEKFYENERPSLVLAHSARGMHEEFQNSILNIDPLSEDYQNELTPAGSFCASWLADMSKKSLLAHVGVGTIDQALLSVLRTSHNTLRLWGLLRKVIILDEVHAYDSYTAELIVNLIRFHSAMGGSTILLSATLPEKMRHSFMQAFADGYEQEVNLEKKGTEQAYPLLTMASNESSQLNNICEFIEEAVESRSSVSREVKVEFQHELDDIFDIVIKEAENGKAIVWVRNTVKDAMDAYERLANNSYIKKEPILFHSRFALEDRLNIENQVLNIFGKKGTTEDRKGRVLIATQVVEQSLDLDFDEMITDLCPIDLILQRAGRLHRHVRDSNGNIKKSGDDERKQPILQIYSPRLDQEVTEKWYANYFKGAAFVYNNHEHLFKTAKMLHDKGQYKMPEDARNLIESVYGNSGLAAPQALKKSAEKYRVKEIENEIQAIRNCFELKTGYIQDRNLQPWPEDKTPTRLGDESLTLRLCVYKNGKLTPYVDKGLHQWQRSEVRVPAWSFYGMAYREELKEIVKETENKLPDKGRYGRLLPIKLQTNVNKIVEYEALIELKNNKIVTYNKKKGLIAI